MSYYVQFHGSRYLAEVLRELDNGYVVIEYLSGPAAGNYMEFAKVDLDLVATTLRELPIRSA